MMMKLQRLWIQLTADRKRFATLCGVLLVAMLLWSRLIVVSRMPRMAIAEDDQLVATGQDNQSARRSMEPIRVQFAARPLRDPFVISPEYFPKLVAATNSEAQAEKSDAEQAEEAYQIEARLTEAMQSAIGSLRLEAVMSGTMAVISGKTYRTGDSLTVSEGLRPRSAEPGRTFVFRLDEVKQRSVVLECDGRRFEVVMVTPKGS